MAQTLEPLVHPTAVVSPRAELGTDVRIGPFSVVGDGVRIGARTRVGSHVVIEGPTVIGDDNVIFPFAALGHPPQDLKYAGEPTELRVGDRNQIREYVTLHRGTAGGFSFSISRKKFSSARNCVCRARSIPTTIRAGLACGIVKLKLDLAGSRKRPRLVFGRSQFLRSLL